MEATATGAQVNVDPARDLAYRILAGARPSAPVADLLHAELQQSDLTEQQRRFVTELVLGSTRMQGRLDADLAEIYNGRYNHLERTVRQLLRMGAYQLAYMDAVPDRAAVHTTVELARALHLDRATGLINAVLRKVARHRPDHQAAGDSSPEALAKVYSHPVWLVEKWLQQWSRDDVVALMEWNNQRPEVWLRTGWGSAGISRLEALAGEQGLTLEPHSLLQQYVTPKPAAAPLLSEDIMGAGLFIVQDPSAGAVLNAIDAQPGETIIDLCAGPGGKGAAMAAAVGPAGEVHAYEIKPGRVRLMQDTINRLGIKNIHLYPGDAREQTLPTADKIVLDVPCAGTGVMARRADLRWRRKPEDLAELGAIQQGLLDHAAQAAKPGTEIIYATCSLEPEENWAVVDSFLERHTDFAILPMPEAVPPDWVDDRQALRTFPPRHQVDGVFAVKMVRQ